MKSKSFILYLVLAAGLLFSFVHCKKDKVDTTCSENPGSCQSVLEAKDYFAFSEGSWWVYEEENSGDRDSVYVTQASIDPDSYNFDVRVYSTYQDYYYHYWPTYVSSNVCNATSPVSKRCLFVNRSKYRPGEYIGESQCFFIKNDIGDYETVTNTAYLNNRLSVDNKLPNYTNYSLNYHETIVYHELNTYVEGKQPTNHFYSYGVGIIRKELLDSNKVWNLVSYHIE